MKKSFSDSKEAFAKAYSQPYNYKKVQSLVEARLIYTGAVTGVQYVWATAGMVVNVDERDVPDLLEHNMGTISCCGGGNSGNKVQVI